MNNQKKILIVEDEMPLANAIKDKLSKEGFSCILAKNGEEGLEMALSEKPDLVLLDIIMPRMDGMTMLSELRKDKWGMEVPVILLTNLSESKKVDEATAHQVYDYLVKSDWKLEDVVEKVKEKL